MVPGQTIVEVKPQGVSKGKMVERILHELAGGAGAAAPDFVLCIGNDRSGALWLPMGCTSHPDCPPACPRVRAAASGANAAHAYRQLHQKLQAGAFPAEAGWQHRFVAANVAHCSLQPSTPSSLTRCLPASRATPP